MIITPSYDELYDFLTEVDKDFLTPLSDKVDLSDYTKNCSTEQQYVQQRKTVKLYLL